MAISETIHLLGTYEDIPNSLELSSISTTDELEYVGDEAYLDLMVSRLIPRLIKEDIDIGKLLEIDFHWICRCLRLMSFGNLHTTNSIFCESCHSTSNGEYRVRLDNVDVKPLPNNCNPFVIPASEFIHNNKDVHCKLLTVDDVLALDKDPMFQPYDETVNDQVFGRTCYMITKLGDKSVTPKDVLEWLKYYISASDYYILKGIIHDKSDYGLRNVGHTGCPKCKSRDALFLALADDRFFSRPWELGDSIKQTVTINGIEKTFREVRQKMYENIVDETLFISRASEGAVSADWVMAQPIFLRKKYVESFSKELEERKQYIDSIQSKRPKR